jgi:hypothetical protein
MSAGVVTIKLPEEVIRVNILLMLAVIAAVLSACNKIT